MPGHEAWIKKASSDLKASKKLLDDQDTLDSAAFHAQQCAEKALKAFLVFLHQPIRKTHDLEFLTKLCCEHHQAFINLKNSVKVLNPYATRFRYPDDRFAIEYDEAVSAIADAEKVLKFVMATIETAIDQNMRIF